MKSLIRQMALFTIPTLFIVLAGCQVTTTDPPAGPTETAAAQTVTPSDPTFSAPATPPAESKVSIGVILFINDNFFKTVALGMEEAAKESGAEIQFRFHEDSTELETQWIQEFTRQNVDAIIISPRVANLNGSLPALQAAYEAGIKIICYNGCITGEARDQYISGIFETDQYALGYDVGSYLAQWLNNRGITNPKLGIVRCCPQRSEGFRLALADNQVVWEEKADFEEYLAEPAMTVVETILQENPDINIIWAENEGATIGAVTAVRALNPPQPVYVFGVDISPEIAQMLLADDDILQAVSAQSPRLMGRLAVEAAVNAVINGTNAGYNIVPGAFFSRDDRDAVETYLQTQ